MKKDNLHRQHNLCNEFRSVLTIDLACKAEGVLGKLFWSSLGVIGILWAAYFISLLVIGGNPIVISIEEISLKEIDKPAITIHTKGTSKFALAERLGNFIHPGFENLPKDIMTWISTMVVCGSVYSTIPTKQEGKYNYVKSSQDKIYKSCSFDPKLGFTVGYTSQACKVLFKT